MISLRLQKKRLILPHCFYCTDLFIEYLLESPQFQEGPFGVTKDALIRGSLAIWCGVGVIVDTLTTMLLDRDFVIGFVEKVPRAPPLLAI